MALSNLTQSVNLDGVSNAYLNHPANVGMSGGYWYYYSSSAANNVVGTRIKPYRWGSALDTNEVGDFLTIQGSIQLVSESLNRGRVFHGSGIVREGPGLSVQLSKTMDDAFFFYHQGDLRASDNIGYWDYAYIEQNTSEWVYFQYHQHNPNIYEDYYDGRQTQHASTWINETDKSFGYLQPQNVLLMGVDYTNVLARVHRPSAGFAHNSHTDQELPATQNKNYIIGGIIAGTSNRFHAFYITSGGTEWDVFSRTYVLSAGSFGAEVNHGRYDLADPTFTTTTTTGNMYNFPIRASAGAILASDVYIPVIYNNPTSGFDLKTWKFESANTILTNTITTQSLVTGVTQRPDCRLTTKGSVLYALISDVTNGGVDLYKFTGSTWNKVDDVILNGSQDIIRIHGFEYNTEDTLFYALLSGDITGSVSGRNYSGSGVYSFGDTTPFTGYTHIEYITGSYGFRVKDSLQAGHLRYNNADGYYSYRSGSEPQGISEGERIITYDEVSPKFYDRGDTKLGGSEFYYGGTQLKDGRLVGVGVIENNLDNLGGYDLIMAIYDEIDNDNEFFGAGGDNDDYFTGIVEDNNKNLWMVGYTKSYLAQKRDILIHGFGRGLIDDSAASQKIEWVDMVLDSSGNQYFAGNHLNNSSSIVGKYNYNFDLEWVSEMSSSATSTVLDKAYGITIDSSNNLYVVGMTNGGGAGGYDAYVTKLDSSGSLQWSKYFGMTGDQTGSSIAKVTKSSTDYIVTSIVSGTTSIVNVLDTNGLIVEQTQITGFTINKVREAENESGGYFLLAGKNSASPSVAQIAKGQVLASGNTIKWVRTYSSGSLTSEAFDIRNTEPLSGSGAQSGPKYHVVGSMGTEGYITKIAIDESAGVFTTTKQWGTSLSGSILTSVTTTPYTITPSGSRFTYVAGHSSVSPEGEGGFDGILASFNYTGSRVWTNTLGHTADEKLFAIERDVTNNNIIVAGWSESHTNGRRTFNFRAVNTGFGTGNHHEKDATGMSMIYQSSSLNTSTNNGTLNTITAPSNIAGGLTATSGSFNIQTKTYVQEFYDGGTLFDFILAKINLDDIAEYKNTDTHKQVDADCDATLEYVNDLFTFYQIGAAGDGSADDGNFFGYDLIYQTGSNKLWIVGQTSADLTKYNLGATGVYDYTLISFDLTTEEFEIYQNGTSADEEIYALCEINDGSGSIAFCGRTTGTLGGTNLGIYDIFLGIYNGVTETFTYFSTGSGNIDKAVNVHDVGNNELALVFETAGTITTNATSQGGLDVGVMFFNYSSSLWSTSSYQIGSTEDEILSQEGKHSTYLPITNRIAFCGKTLGTVADDNTSFDNNDMFLAIFDVNKKTFTKYQIGTEANDTGTITFSIGGDKLVVGGYSDASFGEPNNGIFVKFDAGLGLKGKSSAI